MTFICCLNAVGMFPLQEGCVCMKWMHIAHNHTNRCLTDQFVIPELFKESSGELFGVGDGVEVKLVNAI